MKKTVKNTKAQIALEKKNEAFKKLTKAEKRIEIAKDVIAQVKVKKYVANCGDYILADDLDQYTTGNLIPLQPILLKEEYTCEVCAKGGLFLSAVRKRNDYVFEDTYNLPGDSKAINKELKDIFTVNQLDLMECAFERGLIGGARSNPTLAIQGTWEDFPTALAEKAIDFGKKYNDETDRLVAIMQNLIANKGTFKP